MNGVIFFRIISQDLCSSIVTHQLPGESAEIAICCDPENMA